MKVSVSRKRLLPLLVDMVDLRDDDTIIAQVEHETLTGPTMNCFPIAIVHDGRFGINVRHAAGVDLRNVPSARLTA